MRISDWSSDVCSSDLTPPGGRSQNPGRIEPGLWRQPRTRAPDRGSRFRKAATCNDAARWRQEAASGNVNPTSPSRCGGAFIWQDDAQETPRSEEHTSELQSPMLISYAVFCLKK